MKKPELLAPAGNLEKLKFAIHYGADAVYLAGKSYGLRAGAGNFSLEEMEEGVQFAHERGKKVYVTLNIIPHNADLKGLDQYIKNINKIGIDAVIVADPGVIALVKENAPNLSIALSTQANNTNWKSAKFWNDIGVDRIIVARELSLKEIKEIVEKTPNTLEIEAFIHGAMCISYSGRCLLSNYMTNRDANRGACAHPCRWKYYLMEEKRPGEYYPIYEDESGTHIFNSKDLCMIEHIPELIETGIDSFKIEGRMKSLYYVATIVSAYRKAIDLYFKDPSSYKTDLKWIEEIKKASHRDYTTGFYFGRPGASEQIYDKSTYIKNYNFIGIVLDYDPKTQIATIEQRNRIVIGDEIEIMSPHREYFSQKIEKIWDEEGNSIDAAPHPQQIIKIKTEHPVSFRDILRKQINKL
ncbi:peptidase U32 family protein [Garciella nitratireducens]|uniref:peptidase U32 family protein n=1 Tax=Garciella nitratireducens TaxID=218205 RepID=UPI000DEB494C|nr:U32 family peptidase [Garciella nitratireducens]RBP46685.1 putative protease [Garciella nitratireducens]